MTFKEHIYDIKGELH